MSKVIVQPLIEALSELVAQVSAIIVEKKATNSPPPQELPMCVAGIGQAAAQLVTVAKQLADDEYEDFPVIESEIVCGATDVENASQQLTEATVVLVKGSEDERPGAWDSLGEAVRIMAQNTAVLLHIVYGAEIKKVFALSNYAGGKLADLLKGVQDGPVGLYEKNPQLFVNKVQAAMQDVQKLAQGLKQKAAEEDSGYAKKELEDVADKLLAGVEPFVAHANQLLADPTSAEAKQATVNDLKDMMSAAEQVGAPKPNKSGMQQFIPELMEVINEMQEIEPATPEGQKVADRLRNTLDGITRANRVEDMGPYTRTINQMVELYKDLDELESQVDHPDSKPLGATDPMDVTDPHAQGLLQAVKKIQPDEDGGQERVLQDAEKLAALVTNDLLPLCRNVRSSQDAAEQAKAKDAIAKTRAQLDELTSGMGLSPDQTAQVKGAAKINSVAIKLGAMAGSKAMNKQDIFSAAKGLTDMMSEMSALLGLAQSAGKGATTDGAGGALQSQMDISASLVTPSQPKPTPKPGAAKKLMKKVAPKATTYKAPATSAGSRDSVGAGFLSVGVGAEELKTISAAKLQDDDPVITGVRSLGEHLAALSKAATGGDNATLLQSGKQIHEEMKTYSALLKKKAASCKDPRTAHELIALANQLKNWSVQLKILTSVKASSGGGRDSDKALINLAQLINKGLSGAPNAVIQAVLAEQGAARSSQRNSVRK